MTDVSAQGAAIADRSVCDPWIGFAHQRTVLPDECGSEQRGVTCERADYEFTAFNANLAEAGDAIDVDHHLGFDQPKVHHRHKALAAREDGAGSAVLRKRRERLGKRSRADVIKNCWFHGLGSSL